MTNASTGLVVLARGITHGGIVFRVTEEHKPHRGSQGSNNIGGFFVFFMLF